MNQAHHSAANQPEPFTPGLNKEQVRAHAYQLFRDKLAHEPLSVTDWVLAEKDLVLELQVSES